MKDEEWTSKGERVKEVTPKTGRSRNDGLFDVDELNVVSLLYHCQPSRRVSFPFPLHSYHWTASLPSLIYTSFSNFFLLVLILDLAS